MGGDEPGSIRLHVWGDRACFPRPEIKYERVSYDAITPAAARGILSSIHWRPAMRWYVDRIHILRPIRFQDVGWADPLASAINRNVRPGTTPRAAVILIDVAYLIEAHFTLVPDAGPGESTGKHSAMFKRHVLKRQPSRPPSMGLAALPADYELLTNDDKPASTFSHPGSIDLGWMHHDFDYEMGQVQRFFRARVENGVIDVPPYGDPDLAA